MVLNLVMDEKGNKKSFHIYSSCKKRTGEDVGPLLSEAKDLMVKDMEKDKILNVLFVSVFISEVYLQEC